jgi:uncharacterized OsmC-like protein
MAASPLSGSRVDHHARDHPPHPTPGAITLKITLLSDESIRLEGSGGPLTIEADDPQRSYSPFHMLASSLATCVYSVLHSWGENADIPSDDLAIEVSWTFAEDPYRVGSLMMELDWPSLPEKRRKAAERAAHLCTIHSTLSHPPEITTTARSR